MLDTGPDFGAPAITEAVIPQANAQPDCLIERMPPEVLREIFLNSTSNFDSDWVSGVTSVEMVLSHVCGVWRELSLATPELWTSISLRYDKPERLEASENPSLRRPAVILERWLQLSQSQPVQIRLWYSNDPMTTNGLPSLLKILSVHSHRWQSVEFYIPRGPASIHGEYGHKLQDVFQTLDAKSLESATIHVNASLSMTSGYLSRWVKHVLLSAPHLQRLDWSAVPDVRSPGEVFPFCSLKHLRIPTYLGSREILSFLEMFPALSDLVVAIGVITVSGEGPMVNHSNLQSLSFATRFGSFMRYFLDKLNVPSLRELHVLSPHRNVDLSGFTPMLERSHANLEWLQIVEFDASRMQPPILTILRHPRVRSSLTRLSIATSIKTPYWSRVPIPNHLLEQLVFKPENAFLPKLQSLTITVNLDTQADLLWRLLSSRPQRYLHEAAEVPHPLWRIRLLPCVPVQATKGIRNILETRGVEVLENSRWILGTEVQYNDGT